ncbi:MAG: hypothetical protein JWM68_237 [Verrucomicrobiales bacterium]|nr:hypothetical protein [Verrucomicrobiales bacterium]
MQNAKDDWDQENGETPLVAPGANHAKGIPDVSNPAHPATKQPPIVLESFPPGLADSFELLKSLLPRAKTDKSVAARLALLKAHIARIQNGAPAPFIDANAQHIGHLSHGTVLRRQRLENAARNNRDLEEVLSEYDRLIAAEVNDDSNVALLQKVTGERDTAIARLEGVTENKILADGKVNELMLQNDQYAKDIADFTGRLESANSAISEANTLALATNERMAAIETVNAALTTERDALKKELEELKKKLKK